jgi:hypothetical protein
MKNLILTTSIFLLSVTITTAASPTPTPTKSEIETPISSSSSELTEAAVEKIKDVVKNNPTTTPPATTKPSIIGLVGHIKNLNSDTISLIDKSGSVIQIKTDETTTLLNGSKSIKFKDLAVNDRLIVIGTNLNTNDILLGKRIIITQEPKITTIRSTIAGTITKVDSKNKTINLKTLDQKDLKLTITSKTSPVLSKLEEEQKIIGIISTNTETDTQTLLLAKILE